MTGFGKWQLKNQMVLDNTFSILTNQRPPAEPIPSPFEGPASYPQLYWWSLIWTFCRRFREPSDRFYAIMSGVRITLITVAGAIPSKQMLDIPTILSMIMIMLGVEIKIFSQKLSVIESGDQTLTRSTRAVNQ
jgi:hypothetical protein